MPAKPCEGRLSDDAQAALTGNRNREQFAVQTCEVCGVRVRAIQNCGKWVPEQHWPSVKYLSRVASDKKRAVSSDTTMRDEVVLLAK